MCRRASYGEEDAQVSLEYFADLGQVCLACWCSITGLQKRTTMFSDAVGSGRCSLLARCGLDGQGTDLYVRAHSVLDDDTRPGLGGLPLHIRTNWRAFSICMRRAVGVPHVTR